MQWEIRENEECLCPGLTYDILPRRLPVNLHVLHRQGQLYLNAQNIAGVVPLNDGHSVRIMPKYEGIDPIQLLLYANGANILDNEEKIAQFRGDDGEASVDHLRRMFINELQVIGEKPLKFSRLKNDYIGQSIKGSVNWVATDRLHHEGKVAFVAGKKYEAVTLIPENAIIALAARRVLPLCGKDTLEFRLLHKWATMPVQERHLDSYISSVERYMKRKQFGGAHGYLYRAVVLAEILLGFGGLAGGADYADDAMLFNMPSLYEDAVRTSFQKMCSPKGLTCQKGFAPRSFLFSSGDCEVIPDITIYKGIDVVSILDVKYKTPDSKDYYQIFTYMVYSGLSTAHIISPAVTDNAMMVAFDEKRIILHQACKSDPDFLEAIAQDIVKNVI